MATMKHDTRHGRREGYALVVAMLALVVFATGASPARANPDLWKRETCVGGPCWSKTDFSRHSVAFGEILSGGPRKDGIPAIDRPRFVAVADEKSLAANEPVVSLVVKGDARAYPLRVLTWHEIANDVVGGVPVTVTYCPLCNSAIVFDRRLDGRTLDFGTTGKLRNSDLVMYDRQTESWWQQFTGEAIIGSLTGRRLKMLPARLESFAKFRARHAQGKVLVPTNPGARPYGRNPYVGYDSSRVPFLYRGEMPEGIQPMARIVVVEADGALRAVSLALLAKRERMLFGDVLLTWEKGQASALDVAEIARGRDVGNVVARRKRKDGSLEDIRYDVTFAFVFHAFRPDATIITSEK